MSVEAKWLCRFAPSLPISLVEDNRLARRTGQCALFVDVDVERQ